MSINELIRTIINQNLRACCIYGPAAHGKTSEAISTIKELGFTPSSGNFLIINSHITKKALFLKLKEFNLSNQDTKKVILLDDLSLFETKDPDVIPFLKSMLNKDEDLLTYSTSLNTSSVYLKNLHFIVTTNNCSFLNVHSKAILSRTLSSHYKLDYNKMVETYSRIFINNQESIVKMQKNRIALNKLISHYKEYQSPELNLRIAEQIINLNNENPNYVESYLLQFAGKKDHALQELKLLQSMKFSKVKDIEKEFISRTGLSSRTFKYKRKKLKELLTINSL